MSSGPIVMYHAVDTLPDPLSVQVTPDRLRRQLRTLRRLGLRGVSVRELLAARSRRRLVGLTFDDGYADFATTAVSILDELGFTATVFAVAGRLGGANEWDPPPRRPLMTAEQLRAVHQAGHEVGSHGMWHARLDQCTPEALTEEVADSRRALEDVVGAPVTGFCYPYGATSPEAVAATRDAYDYACAIRPTTRGRWELPRFFVGEADGGLRLSAKLALRPLRERTDDRRHQRAAQRTGSAG